MNEKPLVTFALFAYNQEQYIREAVEGAFAQTYEPLEIILSDDCSTDRTFEIMQEMAAEYEGPHEVLVTQSQENRGLAAHINRVSKLINGDIVVMAAGDDISYPQRTEKIARVFQAYPDTTAVFSNYNTIPQTNDSLKYGLTHNLISLVELIMGSGGIQKGATYAYSKKCFSWPTEIPNWIKSEDRVLPFRAALLGRLIYCSEKLIQYRLPENQNEVDKRKARVLSYQHKDHFPYLENQLREAHSQKLITTFFFVYLYLILQYRSIYFRVFKKDMNALGYIFIFPLRILRKLSIWYVNYNSNSNHKL